MEHLSGVLNINKEEGPTSHDVVAKLRKLLGLRQIGHTGTLDPGATGVLVLCIGQATRIAQYFEALDKAYEAELILGITTTTEDKYGEVLSEKPVEIEEAQLAAALEKFCGPILQIPPMYSAVRHKGVRLHELARQGKVVERKPREGTIHKLELLSFEKPNKAKLYVECSKGTYIRTLCADIGEELGTGAHMGGLVRLSSGHFKLEDAVTLDEVEAAKASGRLEKLIIPLREALSHWPKLLVDGEEAEKISHGGRIKAEKEGMVRIEDRRGRLLALGRCQGGVCQPVRVFR